MRKINVTYTKKQNLLRQQEQIYFNTKVLKFELQTIFMELSLNIGVKWRNLATSSILHSVHDTGRLPPW